MKQTTPYQPPELDTPLWRYALAFYRRPGVSEACLSLQAHIGLDVCVLIYALYAVQSERLITADSLLKTDQVLKAWREQVVMPLRQIRQATKFGISGIAQNGNNWVREQIKTTEVNAEQVALAYLDSQIYKLTHTQAEEHERSNRTQHALNCVLDYFAKEQGHSLEALQSADVRSALALVTKEALDLQKE
jgi:uncharacterized protein (TIGR02444 family)